MSSSAFVSVEYTVIVNAPLKVVFERWDKAEDHPTFMEGCKSIRWLDEKRFELISEHEGNLYTSICELALRIPERRLAWRTVSGPDSSGVACFTDLHQGRTEVTLKMRYNPATGWHNRDQVESRLQRNLERFKGIVEKAEQAAVGKE